MKKLLVGFACLLTMAGSQVANATSLTIDELLYQSDPANPNLGSQLAANVSVTASGSTLTFLLQNTSGSSSSSGASVLLTGLGFNLPTGLSISSGTAAINPGSAAVGFPGTFSGTDISKEWGYQNGQPTSGHLDGDGTPGLLFVNAVVSAMQTDATTQFASASIDNPIATGNLGGPDFGAISSLGNAGGQEAVQDTIKIVLSLSSAYSGGDAALEQFIENNPVVVTFGSPDSRGNNVPDAATTMSLLGMGLAGLGLVRRRLAR